MSLGSDRGDTVLGISPEGLALAGWEMELWGFDSAKGLPWRCRARRGGVRQSAGRWFGLLRISRRSATTREGEREQP